MKKLSLCTALFCFTFFPLVSFAHPGRTDSSGCHSCKTNCPNWGLSYGEYHCHNSKSTTQPKEPIKSTYGANGTGSVSPAPEYKTPNKVVPVKTNIKATPTQVDTTVPKSNVSPVPKDQKPKEDTLKTDTQVGVKNTEKDDWFSRLFSWFK